MEAEGRLTHGFGLLSLGVEDGELELGTDLALGTADQEQVEGQVVLALLIQPLGVNAQAPEERGQERKKERKGKERTESMISSRRINIKPAQNHHQLH